MKNRYFYDESNNRICFVVQNPCGCHPCDLYVQWGKAWTQQCSISFKDDAEIEEYLEKWVELK